MVMVVFDVVVTLFGLYMVFTALQMKRTGEISATILSREESMRCKRKEEFISFMYWKEAIFGVIIILVGALSLVDALVVSLGSLNLVEMFAFLIAFIWFTRELRKARSEFC